MANPSPVCATCMDTRLMRMATRSGDESRVMCTHCPVPCKLCRSGAYCANIPCACACHTAAPKAKVVSSFSEVGHARLVLGNELRVLESNLASIRKRFDTEDPPALLAMELHRAATSLQAMLVLAGELKGLDRHG